MAEPRVKILPGTGNVTFDVRFATKAFATLTGNVTLELDGIDDGEEVSIWVAQDATGGRTLTITPPAGGSVVVLGASQSIDSAASQRSRIKIAYVDGNYFVQYYIEGGV